MRVVIYSRVSTQIQEYRRQTEELSEYARKQEYEVMAIFEEKVSGAKSNEDRPVLMEMMSFIEREKVDKVLCWELSRIGRNAIEVLKTIQMLIDRKVSLFIKNFNIETLESNGTNSPFSTFMIQVLTSVSEMEKSTIRQRIKSGYDHYRSNGGKVGRKEGFRKDRQALLTEHEDIVRNLRRGHSVRDTMKLTQKSSGTVQKIRKMLNIQSNSK